MAKQSNRSVTKWVERLEAEIVGCGNCQPWDTEDETYFWVDGEKSSVENFLWASRVPERLQERIVERLHCGGCNASLTMDDWVGVRSSSHREYDRKAEAWRKRFAPKMEDFGKWLERYPYMGLQHPIGRRIWKEMADFPKVSWSGETKWWRARPLDGSRIYTAEDLGPPPQPPGSEGRFNHHGQIVWYLADEADTAAAETIGQDEGVAWVMQFSVGPARKILDLTPMGHPEDLAALPLFSLGLSWTQPHLIPAADSQWKPQYFIPRFIADCARAQGFDGVLYHSAAFYGRCLVLFNWSKEDVIPIGSPQIHRWSRKEAEAKMPF